MVRKARCEMALRLLYHMNMQGLEKINGQGVTLDSWNEDQEFSIFDKGEDRLMNQMMHSTQALIRGMDMWKPGATDGTQKVAPCEFRPEAVGATEQEEDRRQLHCRRRARRAAGGAIAGMMAAKRATQQIGAIEANGFSR